MSNTVTAMYCLSTYTQASVSNSTHVVGVVVVVVRPPDIVVGGLMFYQGFVLPFFLLFSPSNL